MDDECGDLQKAIAEVPMDADEGPLINENSNGLSHLLTEGEFNSVDAVGVDESSASNQGFLNAVELSTGSVGDYLENNSNGFNAGTFDVGDNAVTFPNDSINATMSGSRDTAYMEAFDAECEFVEAQNKMETDNEADGESNDMNNVPTLDNTPDRSEDVSLEPIDQATIEQIDEVSSDQPEDFSDKLEQQILDDQPEDSSDKLEQQILDAQLEDSSDKLETVSQEKLDKLEQQILDDQPEDSIDKMESQDKLDKLEDVSQDKFDKHEQQNFKEVSKQEVTEISQSNHEETCEKNIIPKENKSDNVAKVLGAEETEVVSEDELPTVEKPSIKDAENVSDDELPGPKPADLPADTEVVSEDELPTSKKEAKETRKRKPEAEGDGYSPGSPTSESESASKKQAVVKNGESKPVPAEKRPSTDEKQKKKALPELDKYWKVVNDDPTDFTGWTYLLQYVDQESDVEASREAYDAFLSHYPYCYGYWRKYADYEKRKGSKKKCLEVLERGLKSIPLSVDLWIHYLNHVKTTRTEEHAYIRSQYERAIEACGLEFRSDRLWESYIKWEAENGSALNVTNIYDRLLATPTLGYTSHFDNFQEHVMSEPVSGVIGKEELIKLRAEVRAAGGTVPQLDLPPGEDEPADHVASEEEGQAIKERIIAARRKVHKTTGEEVASRWTFEEGIKRPYFHVKPLERCQLKNWKSYLEWEKQHGTFKRALVLHERCLIACALYDEFWMRLVKFLEERSESSRPLVNLEREVLERACTVHHLDKHELHMYWAHFEEAHGNAAKAADILERIEKACPQVVQIQYRRVNLERRRGDYDKCCQLYEAYISGAKSKQVASALAVKYARFLSHVRAQPGEARRVLDEAVARDPLNARLHLQRLDLALHQPATPYAELEELVTSYEKQEGSEAEVSAEFAWRRRELAEELGDAAAARTAAAHQRALARHLRKRARKEKHDSLPSTPAASPTPPAAAPRKRVRTRGQRRRKPKHERMEAQLAAGTEATPGPNKKTPTPELRTEPITKSVENCPEPTYDQNRPRQMPRRPMRGSSAPNSRRPMRDSSGTNYSRPDPRTTEPSLFTRRREPVLIPYSSSQQSQPNA